MILALISDTHGLLPDSVPPCDAIIHAGDIAIDGWKQENWLRTKFNQWVEQMAVPVYATYGNHDNTKSIHSELKAYAHRNLHLLVDESVVIGNTNMWFSPWSPQFGSWYWMKSEDQLFHHYANIPEETEWVISHSPPYGAGDSLGESCVKYDLPAGHRVGSWALRKRLFELQNTGIVVCGHIHEDYGRHILGLDDEKRTGIINVSSVDGSYIPREDRWTLVEIKG